MKIYWAVQGFLKDHRFGMSVHNKRMREALERAGAEIILDPAELFDVALHITIGRDGFQPVEGKRNVFFTVAETAPFPLYQPPNINQADLVLVPSSFCVPVVATVYNGPILTCPEGCDPDLFPFVERRFPSKDEPFRFLSVANAGSAGRKGQHLIIEAFLLWLQSGELPNNCQVYLRAPGDPSKPAVEYLSVQYTRSDSFLRNKLPDDQVRMVPMGIAPSQEPSLPGIVIDRRELPVQDLARLYAESSAYLAPSQGEAWHLALSDAFASGLPCAWTHHGGVTDYATGEDVGYPIREFELLPTWLLTDKTQRAGLPETFCYPTNPGSVLEAMKEIYRDYSEALRRGRSASDRMHQEFTWDEAAKKLLPILEGLDQIVASHQARARRECDEIREGVAK